MRNAFLQTVWLLTLSALSGAAGAAVCSSTGGGVWTAAIWGAACPAGGPTAADDVTINNANAITFPVGAGNYFARTLTFSAPGGAATLTHAANQTLTVGVGGVTLNSSSATNGTKAWSINTGSATVNGNVVFTQGSNNVARIARINLTTGPTPAATLTINGNLTFNVFNNAASAVINTAGGGASGQINLSGLFTVTSNATMAMGAGTAIFNYNGVAATQTVRIGSSLVVYRHLRLNNTNAGGATLSAAITAVNVTGGVRVQSGILDNGGFAIAGNAAQTFQVDDGATFRMSGAAAFPTAFGTFTFQCATYPTCSTVSYRQTTNPLTLTNPATGYGHLDLAPAGTAVQRFAAGTYTINGDLTVGNGTDTTTGDAATNNPTLDVNGGVTINASGTLTAPTSNPFTVARDWSRNATGTFTPSTGTVTFDGTTASAIGGAATTFNNLTLTKTAAAVVTTTVGPTINGTLTISNANSTLADGGNTITVNGNLANIAGTHSGAGKILLSGGAAAHSISGVGGTWGNLELNDALGAQLAALATPTISGTLTLTAGIMNASTNTRTVVTSAACPGSLARTNGWVFGNLQIAIPAGTPDCTFFIGDSATNYTPLRVNFASVALPGNLTATLINTEHPNTTAGTAGIDATRSINRYWTLKSSTATGTYTATFNYIDGTPVDRDAGATAAGFTIRRGASCTGTGVARTCSPWVGMTVPPTPGNTQAGASGVTIVSGAAEADFVVGQLPAAGNFSRERQFIYTREFY